MTNEQQFRADVKAAGFETCSREYKGRKTCMVRLNKFSKLVEVGACTLTHVSYLWVAEDKLYAFPVAPDEEYQPAYHVIEYVVCQYKLTKDARYLQAIVHCTTARQARFIFRLYDTPGHEVTIEESQYVKKVHKASTYKLRFYLSDSKEQTVFVPNRQVGVHLGNLWKAKYPLAYYKLQKKLPELTNYEFPAPPYKACQVF